MTKPDASEDIACERCRFWDSGACHRFPQAVAKEARDWCGEFQAPTKDSR